MPDTAKPPCETLRFFDEQLDLFTQATILLPTEILARLSDTAIKEIVDAFVENAAYEAGLQGIPWVDYNQPAALRTGLMTAGHLSRENAQIQQIIDQVLNGVLADRDRLLTGDTSRRMIAERFAKEIEAKAREQGLHWDEDRSNHVRMGVIITLISG